MEQSDLYDNFNKNLYKTTEIKDGKLSSYIIDPERIEAGPLASTTTLSGGTLETARTGARIVMDDLNNLTFYDDSTGGGGTVIGNAAEMFFLRTDNESSGFVFRKRCGKDDDLDNVLECYPLELGGQSFNHYFIGQSGIGTENNLNNFNIVINKDTSKYLSPKNGNFRVSSYLDGAYPKVPQLVISDASNFWNTDLARGASVAICGDGVAGVVGIGYSSPTVKSVTSITKSDLYANVTCTGHGFQYGQMVTISGANQSEYNGTFTIIGVYNENEFLYKMNSEPSVSPATGTITATVYGAGLSLFLYGSTTPLWVGANLIPDTPYNGTNATYNIGSASYPFNNIYCNNIIGPTSPNDIYFGDGSDGDVTISVDTTLTEDKYYNNLTISAGYKLDPNGYRIFVKDTLDVYGTISVDGNNGEAGGDGVTVTTDSTYGDGGTPGAGGAARTSGTIFGGVIGGNGATGGNGLSYQNGGHGTNGENTANAIQSGIDGRAGGDGGRGAWAGDSGYGLGGGGGHIGVSVKGNVYLGYILNAINLHNLSGLLTFAGGSGGGGGGGGGRHITTPYAGAGGGGGGGSGSSGGIMAIYAKNIILESTAVLSAVGGNGGKGGNGGSASGNLSGRNEAGGGGGGGSGGSGGLILLVYNTITKETGWTFPINGGTGAIGGTKGNGGSNQEHGVSGTTGVSGLKIEVQI
jgi:hypothetical protein